MDLSPQRRLLSSMVINGMHPDGVSLMQFIDLKDSSSGWPMAAVCGR